MSSNPDKEATFLLEELWWPAAGPEALPVDPIRIADALGISVREAKLSHNISGAIVAQDGDIYIMLNESDSRLRKRFTIAHELGHYMERVSNGESTNDLEFVEYRSDLSSGGTDAHEIWANRFAAELLMPKGLVHRLRKSTPAPYRLALIFEVSEQAMQTRLRSIA